MIERIHRVTRQRRLTVPNGGGTEGTDPAVVASYLDNQLGPEQVAEFEKKCLTSDVHLAEVASVHQILSLIGQKAKVPPAAKQRMYHLIRGPEATGSKVPRVAAAPAEPVAAPVAPWVPAEYPQRSAMERYWPVAAVVALMGLLIWSAMTILGPSTHNGGEVPLVMTPANEAPLKPTPEKIAEASKAKEAELIAAKVEPPPVPEVEAEHPAEGTEVATSTKPMEPAPLEPGDFKPAESVPPGAVGLVSQADGVLLRALPADGTAQTHWERLAEKTPLREGDRIAGLDPYRSTIRLGEVKVDLVQDAEIVLKSHEPSSAAGFELARGRVVLHVPHTAAPIVVEFAKVPVTINPPADGVIGLERVNHRVPGATEPVASAMRVYGLSGEVALAVGGTSSTFQGPGSVLFQPPLRVAPPESGALPTWVTEAGPSLVQQQLGKQFAAYFKGGTPLIVVLMEAQTDEQKEVRRLAIQALGEVVSLDVVVTALSTKDDRVSRRAAINVLRDQIARSPGAMRDLKTRLEDVGGSPWASAVERLLIGFSADDAAKEKTYIGLIADLKNLDPGIRELALENLMSLTGRDSLGYDPDQPEGPGQRAWKDLLDRKELPPRVEAPAVDADAAKPDAKG
ncbi:MAG: HEAT repeat domain-containing protein [Isosphaeraceae bacterium]